VDYAAVRGALASAIPFNRHVGLDIVEVGDGTAVVRLPQSDDLLNHVGSQHAGALFSAGEAASGGAFVGAFAEHMAGLTPLARSASISYLKIAKGPITATATLGGDKADLLATLESDGRVEFPVEVSMTDEGDVEVARMTVDWHVRRNAG
jgi:acyl-coenzyme A thioesterase PaaI-like protein